MRRLGIVVACVGSLSGVVAQQTPHPMDAQPQPTFRATTRLVEVAVVVRKDGNPVGGLTSEDFRVLDNGTEERVAFFRAESDAPPVGEAAVSPGEFSNRLPPRLGAATVILFDRLNTQWEDLVTAREAIIAFLRQIQPDDRVALYVLESNRMRVLHDFTSNAQSLLAVLARTARTTSREPAPPQERPLPAPQTGDAAFDAETEAWLREASRKVNEQFASVRAGFTTDALEAIAGHLAGVPGRKNLLWVSSAFPRIIYQDGFVRTGSNEIRRATAAVNNANIAMYPIDARGLVGALTAGTAQQAPRFTTLATGRPNIDTMETLAEATGGRAFYNTNDITGSIRRAIDDGRATYVLGFYPSHDRWDGKFHEVKIKVSRPRVDVRHRKGYLALPIPSTEAASRDERLGAAVSGPLQMTGLGVTARVEKGAGGPGGGLVLVITVDPRGVTLQPEGDKWIGAVDVVIAQDLPGASKTSAYFTINLKLGAEQRERVSREGLVVSREVDLREDAHRLRVVALDLPTGAIGSLIVPAAALRAAAGR